MRRFLYFIPGVGGASPKMLADRGLYDRFESPFGKTIEHCVASIMEGPAGSGCIVCAGGNPPEYSAKQQWVEGEKFWVGVETQLPTPADLEREVGLSGYEVKMADGQVWRVPLIRKWDATLLQHIANLPQAMIPMRINGVRKYTNQILPQYASLDAMAERIFTSIVEEQAVSIDSLCDDAVDLLAVNYRIGTEEAGLLGLLDEESARRVVGMAIDEPAMVAQAREQFTNGLHVAEPVIADEPE